MNGAAEAESNEECPWIVRPYNARTDEEGIMYMLRVGYTRSRAGHRAKAERAGGSKSLDEHAGGAPSPEAIDRQRAFMDAHQPIWVWLLRNADVSLAVDRADPKIILGWLITSRPNIVHVVGVKRNAIEHGFGPEIARELLGDRLDTHQVCTLEAPQMRTRGGNDSIGIDRPREWSMDPTWLLTRMVTS